MTYLRCVHAVGPNRKVYHMKCDVLKTMPDGKRVKVRVYGERNWRDKSHLVKVRYVDKDRIVTRDD